MPCRHFLLNPYKIVDHMKKNQIFTFTAPNGVEVTAVVVYCADSFYICYAQNRLFTFTDAYGEVIVDYCILPEYNNLLETYLDHLVTLAEEQSGM